MFSELFAWFIAPESLSRVISLDEEQQQIWLSKPFTQTGKRLLVGQQSAHSARRSHQGAASTATCQYLTQAQTSGAAATAAAEGCTRIIGCSHSRWLGKVLRSDTPEEQDLGL